LRGITLLCDLEPDKHIHAFDVVFAVKKFLAKEKEDFISRWEEPPKVGPYISCIIG